MVFASLLVLLTLTTGYFYFRLNPFKKVLIKRLDGKTLSIQLTIYGFLLVIISHLGLLGITELLRIFCSEAAILPIAEKLKLPEISRNTALKAEHFIAFAPPFILATLVNVTLMYTSRKLKDYELSARSMDTLEKMLLSSQQKTEILDELDDRLVRLVLRNDKVYIGNILAPDIDNGTISHVELAPLYSGHVQTTDRRLIITANYGNHYYHTLDTKIFEKNVEDWQPLLDAHMSQMFKSFAVVIPVSEIVVASLFAKKDYDQIDEPNESN